MCKKLLTIYTNAMKNIECEIRSFITKKEHDALLKKFKKEAKFLVEDEHVTYYFDSPQDLRIQRNKTYAKVWLKKGKLHDDHREEIEIKVPLDDFDKLEQLFLALGYNISIKWFRTRNSFHQDGIDIALDYTKGYGYIVEFEKLTTPDEATATTTMLKEMMHKLAIAPTAKEVFDKKYQEYKTNWRELLGEK